MDNRGEMVEYHHLTKLPAARLANEHVVIELKDGELDVCVEMKSGAARVHLEGDDPRYLLEFIKALIDRYNVFVDELNLITERASIRKVRRLNKEPRKPVRKR